MRGVIKNFRSACYWNNHLAFDFSLYVMMSYFKYYVWMNIQKGDKVVCDILIFFVYRLNLLLFGAIAVQQNSGVVYRCETVPS